MKLEAVTVCVNYSDFLAATIVHNKQHFDKYVVVSDTKDIATKQLCEHYQVQCIQTDSFYENGDKINKGKGINAGLAALDCDGWVLHLDADIVLPPLFRSIMEKQELDGAALYGADRLMCPTFEAWQEYLTSPKPIHEAWIYIHPSAFPIGVRIAQYFGEGYLPIGYFQLWNPKASGITEYPKEHGAMDRSDVIFAKYFTRGHRNLLPEILVIHLDSEDLNLKDMGKNWNGRQTKLFALPKRIAEAIDTCVEGYKRLSLWNRIIHFLKTFLL